MTIEARSLEKAFRIPSHRIDSLKERAVHPLARTEYRKLRAVKSISFDVHRGEFFGIVGRNGSGKSTLLKLLASIYRADGGTIRIRGRVAPFIELGVGFNHDLSARENVVLNGVMMGLTRREATKRLDAVLDFAELRDFVDLKLKNYSSGMTVRLAFSVMIQSDAEILLVDEVLAVGDAAFQRKCTDVFDQMRDAGRTVVLVTHDMSVVQRYCHRAMLMDQGEQLKIGDPEATGREYLRLNFERSFGAIGLPHAGGVPDLHARLVDAWLEDGRGGRTTAVEQGEPIRIVAVIEARRELASPLFRVNCASSEGMPLFELRVPLTPEADLPNRIGRGERVRLTGEIENTLAPGDYTLRCVVDRERELGDRALQSIDLVHFSLSSRFASSGDRGAPASNLRAVPQSRVDL